jgi:hypothetical protein
MSLNQCMHQHDCRTVPFVFPQRGLRFVDHMEERFSCQAMMRRKLLLPANCCFGRYSLSIKYGIDLEQPVVSIWFPLGSYCCGQACFQFSGHCLMHQIGARVFRMTGLIDIPNSQGKSLQCQLHVHGVMDCMWLSTVWSSDCLVFCIFLHFLVVEGTRSRLSASGLCTCAQQHMRVLKPVAPALRVRSLMQLIPSFRMMVASLHHRHGSASFTCLAKCPWIVLVQVLVPYVFHCPPKQLVLLMFPGSALGYDWVI